MNSTPGRDEASYKEFLEAKIVEKDAEIKVLQEKVKQLQSEKGISSARDGLTFNSHTGLWSDQSGQLYCPKCLDKDKRNPLKNETYGWRCTAGGHYHSNPDRNPNLDPPPRDWQA